MTRFQRRVAWAALPAAGRNAACADFACTDLMSLRLLGRLRDRAARLRFARLPSLLRRRDLVWALVSRVAPQRPVVRS